jgi:hypothetical protein
VIQMQPTVMVRSEVTVVQDNSDTELGFRKAAN